MSKKILSFLFLVVLVLNVTILAISAIAESPSIKLDMTTIELAKGKSVKLTASTSGDNIPAKTKFTWMSSDKKVATVQNGLVKGIGTGSATITCTLKIDDSTLLSSTCEVFVYVPVSKITTNKKTVTINVGSKYQPVVTISPKTSTDKSLLWKSDNESIAIVNESGVITAVMSGKCIITATTKDGSNKTLSIKVFVPTLSTSTKEVNLSIFESSTVRIKYYTNTSNIKLDDKEARNNYFFYEYKDGEIEIRIWPWQTGTSTLTVTDSSSPQSSVKIRIITSSNVGINSRKAFPNINTHYREAMRYGVSQNNESYFFVEARVMQTYYGTDSAWILAYSKGKYDDLVYIEYPLNDHLWTRGENHPRIQEDDVIFALIKPKGIYSYETTSGATNYALQLEPFLMEFEDGPLFYVDESLYH